MAITPVASPEPPAAARPDGGDRQAVVVHRANGLVSLAPKVCDDQATTAVTTSDAVLEVVRVFSLPGLWDAYSHVTLLPASSEAIKSNCQVSSRHAYSAQKTRPCFR